MNVFIDEIAREVRRIEHNTYDVEMSRERADSNFKDVDELNQVIALIRTGDLYEAMDILSVCELEED